MSLDALSMPHAWGSCCVEPWARGRGGAAPAPTKLGCGTDVPASDRRSCHTSPVLSDRRSEIARAQTACSGRGRASPTRRWQPRAWQPGRRRPGRCTARSFGRLAAEPYPLPTAPRAAPAARACPSPATSAPARPPASPGMVLAHGARGWRWRLASRPFMAAPRSAQDFCVNRPRIWLF
jgi:hypothetical protein